MILLLVVLLEGVLAVAAQMLLPTGFMWIEIEPHLPILVAIAAVFLLEDWIFLIAAVGVGLMMDCLSPGRMGGGMVSILLTVILVGTQRNSIYAQSLLYRLVLILAGTYFYLIIDYLFYSLQLQRWNFPFSLWVKMITPALVNVIPGVILLLVNRSIEIGIGSPVSRGFVEDYDRAR